MQQSWFTDTPYCGPWPAPVYTYPSGSPSPSSSPTVSPTPTPSPTPSTGPCDPGTGNLALHKAVSASSNTQNYVAANAVDGDANSYWESANNAFPQSLTVDLCAATTVIRGVERRYPRAFDGFTGRKPGV